MLGSSGAGKTTLAKAIAEKLGLQYVENSAGLILTKEAKNTLKQRYDYFGDAGQVGVINKSAAEPQFGVDFQEWILTSRSEILEMNQNIILDRSPLDPVVFWLNQVVHNTTQGETTEFITRCFRAMVESGVTHVIRVPLQNPNEEIENNGSRCHNWYFQKKIDLLFDLVLDWFNGWKNSDQVFMVNNEKPMIRTHYVNTWDWENRLKQALYFLNKDAI